MKKLVALILTAGFLLGAASFLLYRYIFIPSGNSHARNQLPSETQIPSSEIVPLFSSEPVESVKPPETAPAMAPETVYLRPEPMPVPVPAPEPEETVSVSVKSSDYTPEQIERASQIMSAMSYEEKIYQLFIVLPDTLSGLGDKGESGITSRSALERYPVGGIVYLAKSLNSSNQVKEMISEAQSNSNIGLFIAADEEGGRVKRLMQKLGTTQFDSMFSYRGQGIETAYSNAHEIAMDMLEHNFNVNLAPVADVWSNPNNTVIGDRAYSDDFYQAAELVASAVRGFRDTGIACVVKHFPGHGDTDEDTHYESAYTSKSLDELRAQELLPFISGINAGADMVMLGHMVVECVDDIPTTVSKKVVTGLLRGELGYDGIVITDSMKMAALSGYSSAQAAVMAIGAGVDILLDPKSLVESAQGIIDAINSGELSLQRIEESVMRILLVKLDRGIIV